MDTTNGYITTELILSLALVTLITLLSTGASTSLLTNLQHHINTHHYYHTLHTIRDLSIATQTSHTLQKDSFDIAPDTPQHYRFKFPSTSTHSLNRTLGFTHTGSTQYAGTLTITTQKKTTELTLGIGPGLITIKHDLH